MILTVQKKNPKGKQQGKISTLTFEKKNHMVRQKVKNYWNKLHGTAQSKNLILKKKKKKKRVRKGLDLNSYFRKKSHGKAKGKSPILTLKNYMVREKVKNSILTLKNHMIR